MVAYKSGNFIVASFTRAFCWYKAIIQNNVEVAASVEVFQILVTIQPSHYSFKKYNICSTSNADLANNTPFSLAYYTKCLPEAADATTPV